MAFRRERKAEQARLANRLHGPIEDRNAVIDGERDATAVLYVPDGRQDGKMIAVVEMGGTKSSLIRNQNATSRSDSQSRIVESNSQSVSIGTVDDDSRLGNGTVEEADGSTCNLFEVEGGGEDWNLSNGHTKRESWDIWISGHIRR